MKIDPSPAPDVNSKSLVAYKVEKFEYIKKLKEDPQYQTTQQASSSRPQRHRNAEVGHQHQGMTEMELAFFEACAANNKDAIMGLSRNKRPSIPKTLLDEHNQHPLHVWCVQVAKQRLKDTLPHDAYLIMDAESQHSILNHIDNFGCTPLSIMITYDVFDCAMRRNRYWKAPYWKIRLVLSNLTQQFKKDGAHLQAVDAYGQTVWHGLAKWVCSGEPISGYPDGERFFVQCIAIIVYQFKLQGSLNVNAVDSRGRTGLDIFTERLDANCREFKPLIMNRATFQLVERELRAAGCRRASEL